MRLLLGVLVVALAACSNSGATAAPEATDAPEVTVDPEATADASDTAGVVTFGKSYNAETLRIAHPIKKFKRNTASIAWSAEFIETAGAKSITFVIARVTTGGSESIVFTTDVDVSNPNADIFANKADLASVVDNRAGTYVVRYLREGTVLSEGTFQLVK